jgi:hypothetical protein
MTTRAPGFVVRVARGDVPWTDDRLDRRAVDLAREDLARREPEDLDRQHVRRGPRTEDVTVVPHRPVAREREPLHPDDDVAGDDPARDRVVRVAKREPERPHLQVGLDGSLVPLEGGESLARDLDHREVRTLRDADDCRVVRLPVDEHLERRGAGDDVVVGDGDAGRVDDEPRPAPGAVEDCPHLGVDERALRDDLDDCRLGGVDAVDHQWPAYPTRTAGEPGDAGGAGPREERPTFARSTRLRPPVRLCVS